MEPDVNAKPGPITDPVKSEHSILIIGHDNGNGFVFWDTGNNSAGVDGSSSFGMLWYDSSDDRLSTASSHNDLPVDKDGKHQNHQKRYQIMSLVSK
jgi:hypothetical protein